MGRSRVWGGRVARECRDGAECKDEGGRGGIVWDGEE